MMIFTYLALAVAVLGTIFGVVSSIMQAAFLRYLNCQTARRSPGENTASWTRCRYQELQHAVFRGDLLK